MNFRVQLSRFAIVGVFNTVFNIIMFDLFLAAGQSPIMANFSSLTISIIISFLLNAHYVFVSTQRLAKKLIIFFLGTIVIQIAVQHFCIVLAEYAPISQIIILKSVLHAIAPRAHFDNQFVISNAGKLVGVLISTVLSYFFFREVVFRDNNAASVKNQT